MISFTSAHQALGYNIALKLSSKSLLPFTQKPITFYPKARLLF